jgi:adenylosuccinate synthase
MPVSVVVGGQFGSEGKGKVALEIVRRDRAIAAVRVGGTNSGHTAIGSDGKTYALRQLPAAAADRTIQVILPPGSYIDLVIFSQELQRLGLRDDQVAVSPMARVITEDHKRWEQGVGLGSAIGSTQSGTGAAVLAMTARGAEGFPLCSVLAKDVPELQPYLKDTTSLMRNLLETGKRIVIEGTQGFGLSLLQGGFWPNATSRDTTAAGFLAEAGLSPRDVDNVTMVIRCHPIRVGGNSGPLKEEITWEQVAAEGGLAVGYQELTTATGKVRRVGRFNPEQVREAIEVNRPDRIVLNHLDYIDPAIRDGRMTAKACSFVEDIEAKIGRKIEWLGTGPAGVVLRRQIGVARRAVA